MKETTNLDITIHPHSRPPSLLTLFPSSNRCGTALPPIDVGPPPYPPPLGPASLLAHRLVSIPLQGIARRLAHRPMSGSFFPLIDVGPPPNPPPFWAGVFTGTSPRVYPLQGTTRRLTHRLMSGSDTICNDSIPPLADIVFFRLSLSSFPLRL